MADRPELAYKDLQGRGGTSLCVSGSYYHLLLWVLNKCISQSESEFRCISLADDGSTQTHAPQNPLKLLMEASTPGNQWHSDEIDSSTVERNFKIRKRRAN